MVRTVIKKEFYEEKIEKSKELRDIFIIESECNGYRVLSYYNTYHDCFGFCCGVEMEKIDG